MTTSGDQQSLPSLVTVDWLAQALGVANENSSDSRPRVHVFDCSWYLPIANRHAHDEYRAAHIPTARFFDVDYHADRASPYPHMLPSDQYLTELLQSYGVSDGDVIVCYDASQAFTASARLWLTLVAFGLLVTNVRLLDGGFKEWREKYPSAIATGDGPALAPVRGNIQLTLDRSLVFDKQRVLAELAKPVSERPLFVDAREAARFSGEAPEPRPAKRRGHIPGAKSLWHADLQTVLTTGRQGFKDRQKLTDLVNAAGLSTDNPSQPIVCYCGSGITAATVYFVLHELGFTDLALYDASCAEYLNDDSVPVE